MDAVFHSIKCPCTINAGFVWGQCADKVAFYTDRGWSRGMIAAREYWELRGIEIEIRSLTQKEDDNG